MLEPGDTVKVEGTGNTSSIVHVSGGDTVGTASSGFLNDSGVQQKSYTIENKKDSDNQNNHILIKSSNVAAKLMTQPLYPLINYWSIAVLKVLIVIAGGTYNQLQLHLVLLLDNLL